MLNIMSDENRQLKDRRSRPTRFISRYTLNGRRKKARRQDEAKNYYVDKFEPRHLIMVGLVMIFCILDYGLSFKIFEKGGSELNVLMATFMANGRVLLLLVKLGLTLICLAFILVHKNFKVFGLVNAHVLIYYVFSVYFVLVFYEVFSLALIIKFESYP
jgi:uncharacterized membrane protein YdbT with pleckstrin-like domain